MRLGSKSTLHKRTFESSRIINQRFSNDRTPSEVYDVSPEYMTLERALKNLEANYQERILMRKSEDGWNGLHKLMSFLIDGGIVNVKSQWHNNWKEEPMMYHSPRSELSLEIIHEDLEGVVRLEMKLLYPFRQDKREIFTL